MSAIRTAGLRKACPLASPNGTRERVALEGLDLEVGSGELFGLLGPNGAGKPATMGILTTRLLAGAVFWTFGNRSFRKGAIG